MQNKHENNSPLFLFFTQQFNIVVVNSMMMNSTLVWAV